MKKGILITILILLTSCGTQKVKCTKTEKRENTNINYTANAIVDTGIVNTVDATIEFDEEKYANQYCNILELTNSVNANKNIKYKCNGKTIKIDDYLEVEDIKKGLTRTEFIEKMENEGFICE